MNIRRREGHEWTVGVASRRGVNGTTDILWIESRRSLTWAHTERPERTSVAAGPAAPQLAPVPAPTEVTFRPNMAARAQEVRSLPIGTSPTAACARPPNRAVAAGSTREPACADTDIRKSARDHYLANKLFVLLSKNIRVRRKALKPAAELTRSCTREPLPRRGETDEGRPRRRWRRLRRTRTSPAVPFHGCAALAVWKRPRPLIITAASVEPIDRRVGTNIRPSRAPTQARSGRDEDSHTDKRCLANCSPTLSRRRCASFENFSRKLTCTVAMDEAPAATWPLHEHCHHRWHTHFILFQ